MNLNTVAEKVSLQELIAEKLLYLGFSISFEEIDEIEFISTSPEAVPGGKLFFLPFEPVATNVSDFLAKLILISHVPGTIHIVVSGAGERQILQNILKMQEITGVAVWSIVQLKNYPLQLT